jgi:hypothetical protein
MKMKFILTAILCVCSIAVFSQDTGRSKRLKNEIGLDIANVITFLSKKNESYLLNYKHHFTEKHTLRSGLDLDWSNARDGYKSGKVRVGYECGYPIVSDHWKLHWSVDASFRYHTHNSQPNNAIRYGLTPIIGFSYFPVRRFSISTEMGINFHYTDYRNPASFDPRDNTNVWSINVGSVGMVMLSYHF